MSRFSYFIYLVCFFLLSCSKPRPKKIIKKPIQGATIKYAKGFDIIEENGFKKLLIKTPYPNAKEQFEYLMVPKQLHATQTGHFKNHSKFITVPVEKIVATSTTHIPMIELLGAENYLVGFPHTKYISSKKTNTLIRAGKITEIGKEASLNTEILLDLQPELVVGFSTSATHKAYHFIKQNGIPVILNGDWLEETPLGRAEWIKFFGLIFNKERKADSIFSVIEKNYLAAKKIAKKATTQPTVLSGATMSKDIWSLPAGNSFVAQFLKDANTNYLWQHTGGNGSLSVSFESVLDKAKYAEFWIAPGYFSSKKQLINSNVLYKQFKAFKNNTYTPNLKKGKTGGILYFEFAPIRPDWVLKDLIKITHPELLKNYQFHFFDKLTN